MRYLVILSFLVVSAYGSEGWSKCKRLFPDPKDLPWQPENAVRICREGELAIVYDKDMMNPAISNYHITPKQANSIISGRESDFYQDPDLDKMGIDQLKSDGASLADSSHGGEWDRGHLAPNRIMSYTLKARKSTYTMANIAPQASKFNRSPWKNLETRVVKWIKSNNALHIITGVAYKDRNDVKRESDNGVRPDYFWKVLCDVSNGQAVGFYGANKDKTKSTTDFVTVTEIEEMYGGKLFPRNLCNVDTVSPEYWWGKQGAKPKQKPEAKPDNKEVLPDNEEVLSDNGEVPPGDEEYLPGDEEVEPESILAQEPALQTAPKLLSLTGSQSDKSSTAVQLTSVLSLIKWESIN